MRVELADHVAHGARGLLVLGGGRQPQLAHRVGDAALHRLQPVAERWQRAVEDDVHRVVEIGLLGEGAQRLPLDAFEIQFLDVARAISASDLHVRRLPFCSSHSRRSPARFFASSMSMSWSVLSLASIVSCTRRRVRGSIVVSRSCVGFISPKPLKRVTVGLVRGVFLFDALQQLVALPVIERVKHLLAGVDAIQRRHGYVDVAVGYQRPEMPQEQRA